jgi:hypothetical protein
MASIGQILNRWGLIVALVSVHINCISSDRQQTINSSQSCVVIHRGERYCVK